MNDKIENKKYISNDNENINLKSNNTYINNKKNIEYNLPNIETDNEYIEIYSSEKYILNFKKNKKYINENTKIICIVKNKKWKCMVFNSDLIEF